MLLSKLAFVALAVSRCATASTAAKRIDALDQLAFPAPEQRLDLLSSEEYTTLTHAAFPGYGIRVKRTEGWCDPDVKVYTGYLDVAQGAKHLWFYFFESRDDPSRAPLTMWVTGGPGCSSSIDMFMQLGPCLVDPKGNGTIYNQYGWNAHTNIFFLDQPVNVGFSYTEFGEEVLSTEDAAPDAAAFAFIFTEAFPQFKGRDFHLAGSSYGGRYVPVFASQIVDMNKHAAAKGYTPLNLKSIIIGDGITDAKKMLLSYYDMTCTNASVAPILDISTCVRMKRALPRCEKMLTESCELEFDELACTAATLFCEQEITQPFYPSGKNPYDISVDCEGGLGETLCYPVIAKIGSYLDRPSVRSLLGVDSSIGNFTGCNRPILAGFNQHFDRWKPTQYYVSALLSRGVSVLLYVGTYDWICNWVGNMRWVEALEWEGQEEYNALEWDEWEVDGERAGVVKGAGGLVFATVEEAGHMVAYNKPAQASAMLTRWLASRKL